MSSKISALSGVGAAAGANEVPVNEAGVTKKASIYQLFEFLTSKGANVASAATVVLNDGIFFHITGTTTITDIDFANSWNGRFAWLVFDGVLTLTNSATLVCPGFNDIITGPNDCCMVQVELGDTVRILSYERTAAFAVASNPSNTSTAAQNSITAATSTYITGSAIAIPPSGLRLKTNFHWRIFGSKTAAGTAASSFIMRLGTAGTVADAALLTFTLPVGTANADTFKIDIDVAIFGPLGASCIAQGNLAIVKNAGTILGIVNIPTVCIPVTSGTFNSSTANLIAGISVTSGASVVFSISQVNAESSNL